MNNNMILLSFEDGYYCFGCLYHDCPCNDNESKMCKTKYKDLPIDLLHEFDGKNIIKCLCG